MPIDDRVNHLISEAVEERISSIEMQLSSLQDKLDEVRAYLVEKEKNTASKSVTVRKTGNA